FQAEDGIRGKLVTGVQTCALPIYALLEARLVQPADAIPGPHPHAATAGASCAGARAMRRRCQTSSSRATGIAVKPLKYPKRNPKIGRASCRERAERREDSGGLRSK